MSTIRFVYGHEPPRGCIASPPVIHEYTGDLFWPGDSTRDELALFDSGLRIDKGRWRVVDRTWEVDYYTVMLVVNVAPVDDAASKYLASVCGPNAGDAASEPSA